MNAMDGKAETSVRQEPMSEAKTGYFKAPVFAVAPMIDWTL